MEIVVLSSGIINVPYLDDDAFDETPEDRLIVFLAEDGTELTGDALKAARAAYKADGGDGDAGDNLWWGWRIYTPVTIKVKKTAVIGKTIKNNLG